MVWSRLEKYHPRNKEYFWPISESSLPVFLKKLWRTSFPTSKISHNLWIQTISCCMQCVTMSKLFNFYIFDVAKRSKKGLLQLWILRALNNPQSSILNPRYLVLEVSRATVLVFTCGNKKICLETAVFRVCKEGLRREWIENTFPQVPRRQRCVQKMDSRDTKRCWMRWEISASTQTFTLKENKPMSCKAMTTIVFKP